MANTTSHSYTFDKSLPIDEIVEESYERIGLQNVSGYQLKTAKRSLNILFSEWGNRGIRLNAIAPGPFPTKGAWDRLMPNTDLSDKYTNTVPMGRTGRHSELSNLAAFLLADGLPISILL